MSVPIFPVLFAVIAPAQLELLRSLDQRVTTVGYQLASRAGDLCANRAYLPGFSIHNIIEYAPSAREAAHAAFGLGLRPQVLAVAAGSPADLAGLSTGDELLDVDGPLPPAPAAPSDGTASFATIQTVNDRLVTAVADGSLNLVVSRRGVRIHLRVNLNKGCSGSFMVNANNKLDASADGNTVSITTALTQYADADDELAAVLAHELAHNILNHRRQLTDAGVKRGLRGEFGRSAILTRATEDEADRFSVYLLDHAGYDPRAAVVFWTRLRREHGAGIFRSRTHSSEAARAKLIEKEIANVVVERAAGRKSYPTWMVRQSDAEYTPHTTVTISTYE